MFSKRSICTLVCVVVLMMTTIFAQRAIDSTFSVGRSTSTRTILDTVPIPTISTFEEAILEAQQERQYDLISVGDEIPTYTEMIDIEDFIPIVPDETYVEGYDEGIPSDEEVSTLLPDNDNITNLWVDDEVERTITFALDGSIHEDIYIIHDGLDITKGEVLPTQGGTRGDGGFRGSGTRTFDEEEDNYELQDGGFRTGSTRTFTTTTTTDGGRRSGTVGTITPTRTTTTTTGTRGFRDPIQVSTVIENRGVRPTRVGTNGFSTTTISPSETCGMRGSTCTVTRSGQAGLYTSINLQALSNTLRQMISPILSSFNNKNFVIRNSWPHVELRISSLSLGQLSMTSGAKRIMINLAINASLGAYVRTKLLGSATKSVTVEGYQLSVAATFDTFQNKIKISNISCTGQYIKLNFHSSGGLIMRFILNVVSTLAKLKSIVRTALVDTVPVALKGALTTASLNMVNSVAWKIKVGKWGAGVSMQVTDIDGSQANSIVVGFKAHTINFATGEPFTHTKPTLNNVIYQPNPSHLFGGMADTFIFNDYFSTWYQHAHKTTLFTQTTQPSWLTTLNTLAWNIIFPGIGDNHPQSKLVLKIQLTSAPLLIVKTGIATFKATAAATWAIDNGMGQVGEPLVTIGIDLTTSALLTMKYDQAARVYSLIPTISHITPVFNAEMTMIGPIDMSKVNSTLQGILNYVIVPIIDLALLDGIPIPSTNNFQLTNPQISFMENSILIGSGLNISF